MVKLLHAWWWIKRFLLERRHVLRPWTGTRGVAEGAAGPIDYLHPFLNQMLDYENKGLVRNESPEEKKGWGGEEGTWSRVEPVYAYCRRPREDTLRRVLGNQSATCRRTGSGTRFTCIHTMKFIPTNYILLLLFSFLFFLIYISRNIKIRKHD